MLLQFGGHFAELLTWIQPYDFYQEDRSGIFSSATATSALAANRSPKKYGHLVMFIPFRMFSETHLIRILVYYFIHEDRSRILSSAAPDFGSSREQKSRKIQITKHTKNIL